MNEQHIRYYCDAEGQIHLRPALTQAEQDNRVGSRWLFGTIAGSIVFGLVMLAPIVWAFILALSIAAAIITTPTKRRNRR